jgi:spermidine/putrescine-binding protein
MPKDELNYEELGIAPPTSVAHGEDVRDRLEKLTPKNWRMEGNQLIADTAMGELVQFVSTDYILLGTDEAGLPILKKIV